MKLWGTIIAFCIGLHHHCGHSAEVAENVQQENNSPMVRATRAGLNMLRLGRSLGFRTRGVRMLRLGKRADPLDNLTYDDLKELVYSLTSEEKHPHERQPPLPRYGKRMSPDQAIQLLESDSYGSHMRPAPRLGRFKRSALDDAESPIDSAADDVDRTKDALPIPRFGRLTDENDSVENEKAVDEKAIQENEDELDTYKRGLPMLRLGRSMKMLRLGKRDSLGEDDKRSLALLRLGKRGMRMLRLGKREPELDKRALRILRLGKREEDDHPIETRALRLLRLGRSQQDDKRSLKLLRLG